MSANKLKPWTQADDNDLRVLHQEHVSISDIAAILDRSLEAIRHRKKKLRLGRCLKMDGHNIVRRRRKHLKQAI